MLFLATLAAATLAQAVPAEFTHSVPVAHATTKATAIYTARPTVTTRQIGTGAGPRMSTVRCTWTADIAVDRRLAAPGVDNANVRELASSKTFSGSRHGSCMNNRRVINQEIAAKAPEINAHLVAVAERDQLELRTEAETLAPPTGR